MKRTTVVLPDELAIRLDRERRRRDVSTATIIREAVERYLLDVQEDAFGFIGMVSSDGAGPHAKDVDEYLAAHWADHIANDRGDIAATQSNLQGDATSESDV